MSHNNIIDTNGRAKDKRRVVKTVRAAKTSKSIGTAVRNAIYQTDMESMMAV